MTRGLEDRRTRVERFLDWAILELVPSVLGGFLALAVFLLLFRLGACPG